MLTNKCLFAYLQLFVPLCADVPQKRQTNPNTHTHACQPLCLPHKPIRATEIERVKYTERDREHALHTSLTITSKKAPSLLNGLSAHSLFTTLSHSLYVFNYHSRSRNEMSSMLTKLPLCLPAPLPTSTTILTLHWSCLSQCCPLSYLLLKLEN